jgi:YD repeat-containing protein
VTSVYDANARLLSTKLKNGQHAVLNSHAYGYNAGNQRTRMTNWAANYWEYVYDGTGQLVSASVLLQSECPFWGLELRYFS